MNAATKAVVTHRRVEASAWANSTAVPGPLADWVRATAAHRDIVVIGSGSVIETLVAEDLVDEYRLLTFPTVTGAGRPLFPAEMALELTATERSGPGTLATYSARRA